MNHFGLRDSEVYCEGVGLRVIADAVGTPTYVYSRAALRAQLQGFHEAFSAYPSLICYAVKANGNLSLLRDIFASGCGADLVSIGELERVSLAGCASNKIVFSGVGKTEVEIAAALDKGILAFNVESEFELDMIEAVAQAKGQRANLALRINPDIDSKSHPKIATGLYGAKFGIPEPEAVRLAARIKGHKNLALIGLACHIGSQIVDLSPIRAAAERMADLSKTLLGQGHALRHCDMGGGLGIRYLDENPPLLRDYAATLIAAIKPTGLSLVIEPGRSLVGNAGVLLVKVIGLKRTPRKTFVVVDGAMNDLIRPSLYEAYHDIAPVSILAEGPRLTADVVGPICESGDYLGLDREMCEPPVGSLFYVKSAGAYGMAMASQYNSRPRAAEILVDGDRYRVIRRRETPEDLWRHELNN